MKKGILVLAVAMMSLLAFSAANAEKEVSAGATIFAQWFFDMSDTLSLSRADNNFDDYSAFGINRAYLYAKAKMSEKTWGKATIDVDPANDDMRLKYAFINWKMFEGNAFDLSARVGLQGTPWIDEMNATWGRRYLEKTPTDLLGMETSADFGLSFIGNLGENGKWGYAELAAFNGTSYISPTENNPTKDINLALFITPVNTSPDFGKSKFGFQYYTGTLNSYNTSNTAAQIKDDYKKSIISFMGNVQYRELFALGVEYDAYTSPQRYVLFNYAPAGFSNTGLWADSSDNKVTALALFGTLWFADLAKNTPFLKTTDLFFRYMAVDPDADNHDIGGGNTFSASYNELIFGVECVPLKGVAASLNYRSESFKDVPGRADDVSNSYLYLNMLLSF